MWLTRGELVACPASLMAFSLRCSLFLFSAIAVFNMPAMVLVFFLLQYGPPLPDEPVPCEGKYNTFVGGIALLRECSVAVARLHLLLTSLRCARTIGVRFDTTV